MTHIDATVLREFCPHCSWLQNDCGRICATLDAALAAAKAATHSDAPPPYVWQGGCCLDFRPDPGTYHP